MKYTYADRGSGSLARGINKCKLGTNIALQNFIIIKFTVLAKKYKFMGSNILWDTSNITNPR